MTSKLTRERLEELAAGQSGFNLRIATHEESQELARMALAAMDSEPVAWGNGCDKTVPAALRYLAENERPFGGESRFNAAHLYQLAREIELMAEAPLYRHAQQPVVGYVPLGDSPYDIPYSMPSNLREFIDQEIGILFSDDDAQGVWIACRRAAMLNHPSSIQPNTDAAPGAEIKHPSSNSQVIGVDLAFGPDRTVEVRYVAPAGYVMVPKDPTAEMVIKMRYHVGGYDRNIKEGYKAMLAAADCSIPMISDRWIPVSEKMPPSRHEVLVGRWWGEKPRWCCKWATYVPVHPDAQSSGWLIPGASWTPTHWMPLPAPPTEVK